jgi:hypothetical protein
MHQYDIFWWIEHEYFILFYCAGWGTLCHLHKLLHFIKCIMQEFTPSTFSLPPLIPGVVSKGIIFAFTCIFTFYCIFTFLPPFPNTSPLPLVLTLLSGQDLFCPLVLWFFRRKDKNKKTWHFCFLEIKVATCGVSFWYFHVCMHYNTIGVSLIFFILPSSLSLWWIQFKISIFILV